MFDDSYTNGHLERKADGRYEGNLSVEKVNLSPIEGQYFKKEGRTYLWLKRKPLLEYDEKSMEYKKRERTPKWECYLEKCMDGDTVAFKGQFTFLHWKFAISGVWDSILGRERQHRLNLYVERLPMSQQTIINSINERNRNERR